MKKKSNIFKSVSFYSHDKLSLFEVTDLYLHTLQINEMTNELTATLILIMKKKGFMN